MKEQFSKVCQRVNSVITRIPSFINYSKDIRQFREDINFITQHVKDINKFDSTILFNSVHGFVPSVKYEIILASILIKNGVKPIFLVPKGGHTWKYIRLLPNAKIIFWEDYYTGPKKSEIQQANKILNSISSVSELVNIEYEENAIGRHALSLCMRQHRKGHISLPQDHDALEIYLANSLAARRGSQKLLKIENPRLIFVNERGYTPFGEFFDVALYQDKTVIQYVLPHRDDAMIFKKYSFETREEHPYGLSDESWQQALNKELDNDKLDSLMSYLRKQYEQKTWFNFQRLQHNANAVEPIKLKNELELEANKKTATIFAHILWDATYFYGDSIFDDYEQWLIETIRLANRNDAVNWIIKLHPVNVWRYQADGVSDIEYSEIRALKEANLQLAPHVKILYPGTHINTWSLFQVSDYCVTVRGTVGIEMAALGKQVITAGSSHYSGRGFTTDPKTTKEYEDTLLNIQTLHSLGKNARSRALKFCFWFLKRKPYYFRNFSIKYSGRDDVNHAFNGKPVFFTDSSDELFNSREAKIWAQWCQDSVNPDCIDNTIM